MHKLLLYLFYPKKDIKDDGLWKWNEGRHLSFSAQYDDVDDFALFFASDFHLFPWVVKLGVDLHTG